MFIVWGKKHVRRKMGYVADFCSMCREARVFRLTRVGLAGHVYYITVGDGDLVGNERTCENCGTAFNAEPERYASISKAKAPLRSLLQTTFPNFSEFHAPRLALEEKLRSAPTLLTADEREELLQAPFILLSPKIEEHYASIKFDLKAGLIMLGAFLLICGGPAIVRSFSPDEADMSLLAFILLGIAATFWQIDATRKRFMQRQIIPVLAHALKPLKPNEREISAILGLLKQHKHKIGTRLKAAELVGHLR